MGKSYKNSGIRKPRCLSPVLVSRDGSIGRFAPYHAFLILLGTFLFAVGPVKAREIIEAGDSCTAKTKLPPLFLCAEGFVVDCRNSTDSQELLYCAASESQKADNELNRLYQFALRKIEMPNDEYADYKNAQKAMIVGQRAWVRFRKLDCETPRYLNLKGSIQSNEIVSCELKNTKNRIADLNAYFVP